jgi:capsid protein
MIDRLLAKLGLVRRSPERVEGPASRVSVDKAWRLFAGYDSAKSDGANARHWSNSDNLAAWSANSPEVREALRNRARYEAANNSLLAGMLRTLVQHTVGAGPMLRIDTGDRDADRQIEDSFAAWARRARLGEKLRIMRRSKCVDGEAFALLATNPLYEGVSLDLRLIEADQIATPDLPAADPLRIDGVRFDRAGNIVSYDLLKAHPGDDRALGNTLDYEVIPAEQMLHYRHAVRPGEARGVSELTPALALGAILRRYILATLLNAELNANIAGVMESDAPEGAAPLDPLDAIELEPGHLLTMPDGWKAKRLGPEQNVTGLKEFRREIVNEFSRCLDMPLSIALASNDGQNFASGKLDHGVYYASIRVERREIEASVLHPVFAAWIREAALIPGQIPRGIRMDQVRHAWRWDALTSGDPEKDAKAAEILRRSKLLSLDRYFSEAYGADWERELEQVARERDYADQLGVNIDSLAVGGAPGSRDKAAVGAEGEEDDA